MIGRLRATTRAGDIEHPPTSTEGAAGPWVRRAKLALWLTPVGLVLAPLVRSTFDGFITEEGTWSTVLLNLGIAAELTLALAAPVTALVLAIRSRRLHEPGARSAIGWSIAVLVFVLALPLLLIAMLTNLDTAW